jgi:hypothetical protein
MQPQVLTQARGICEVLGDGPEFGSRRRSCSLAYAYKGDAGGHYAVEPSELGWFTVSGGVYTFHEVQDWSDEVVNLFALIPAGSDWGSLA